MSEFSVHLQDSTVGELGGIVQAVVRGSSVPQINHMDVAVAYASAAGIDVLEYHLTNAVGWREWQKRFLISIDFGTSEPAAFERIGRIPHAEVRIPRGLEVLQRPNLVPRVPFHSKTWTFYSEAGRGPLGLVIGSGNLTRSGMLTGGEMAVAITTTSSALAWPEALSRTVDWFQDTWQVADLADHVVPAYTGLVRRSTGFGSPPEDLTDAAQEVPGSVIPRDLPTQLEEADSLFVRVDRVTRNRGTVRPGNQIDLPLGTRRFFHLPPREMVGVVGEIALHVSGFAAVLRNVRVGANSMDKIDLPVPESVGIDTYDDSYLIFMRTSRKHQQAALFELLITDQNGLDDALVHSSHSVNLRMAGGRQYGLLFD